MSYCTKGITVLYIQKQRGQGQEAPSLTPPLSRPAGLNDNALAPKKCVHGPLLNLNTETETGIPGGIMVVCWLMADGPDPTLRNYSALALFELCPLEYTWN